MKFNKFLLVLAALSITVPAFAQFDTYNSQRSIVMTAPTVLTAAASTVTNGPVDINAYVGVGYIDITTCTNAGGALTATIEQSSNPTNGWTAFNNFALINATTSVTYTNLTIDTNATASNSYLLPGTVTTPTAWSAGFNTSYLAPLPFTNTGAITVTARGVYRVGFKPQDTLRYLHIIWTPTGSSSNDFVAATVNGIRALEVK
jgi:hypothetical protein